MTRKECPFCGNMHVKARATGNVVTKTYLECPRCKARGPLCESVATTSQVEALNEAAARWDERATA